MEHEQEQENQEAIRLIDSNNNPSSSTSSNQCLIYTILIMIIIFIIIEILQFCSNINVLIKNISIANELNVVGYFNQCIKYPLIFKQWYIIYSLSASISACGILLCLIFDMSLIFQKLAFTFIKFNYFMYGPLLCGLTSSALVYYDKTMIFCNIKANLSIVQFSPGLLTNTIVFFIISIVIILVIETYESFYYIVDSILNKPNANMLIRYLFWKGIHGREIPIV